MSRTRLLSLLGVFCLVVLLLYVPLTGASVTLTVNESATRVLFEEHQTVVSLALENPLTRSEPAQIHVELIDPDNVIRAIARREATVDRGTTSLRIPISFLPIKGKDPATEDLLWYRLRYRIASKTLAFDQVNGVIALGEIAPDIFRLQVSAASFVREGTSYRVRVRAEHPLTSRAVANVKVKASLEFEDAEKKDEGVTGSDGYATFDFKVPAKLEMDDIDLEITGKRGLIVREVASEIDVSHHVYGVVNTDKPLYQPGQKLQIRLLFFDASRQALANAEAKFKISNPEGEEVFRTTLTTSRFGVASTEWAIPESTRLGSYELNATLADSRFEGTSAETTVKISRYDLPNFTVDVRADRNYYTPGQDAAVTVRADYLFGEAVKRGHVRIVRELERSWDYREQKWTTREGKIFEGDLDEEGKFVAQINLKEEHADLGDEDYSRFNDLSFAAYFTDPTTNRTEQRRFDLRLTKDPIHVYVIDYQNQHTGLPMEFYLTTFYADGTPAECEVTIAEQLKGEKNSQRTLRTIRTNRLGVAKVSNLLRVADAEVENEELLKFAARDSRGNTGKHTEDFYFQDTAAIRVSTDKTFYRPGEPVRVGITASKSDLRVVVDTVRDWRIIRSEVIQLVNGSGTVQVPYRQEFNDDLTIAVYSLSEADADSDFPHGSHTVIYPRNRDLDLQIALNRKMYRPGEEANIDFITRSAAGKLSESALGVVIFDKAVEERARTDRDLGGAYGFYGAYAYLRGGQDVIAGVSRRDLDRVDLTKPLPEGLELVAEMLLNNNSYVPRLLTSDSEGTPASVFAGLVAEQLRHFKLTLDGVYKKHGVHPTTEVTLRRLLNAAEIQLEQFRDPWDQPYRADFIVEGDSDVLLVKSSGADKKTGTADDFTALRLSWPYFRFTGEAINRALVAHHARTGGYIRDQATLKSELLLSGIDLTAVRDPWSQPYHYEFGINRTQYSLVVSTGGENKQFSRGDKRDTDNFQVWQTSIDYSTDIKLRIEAALANYFAAASIFPQNENEFVQALAHAGIERTELRDPWTHLLYTTFKVESLYNDRVRLISQAKHGEPAQQKTVVTPVTETIKSIKLRSSGYDGKEGTSDDFDIGTFRRITAEQDRTEKTLKQSAAHVPMQGATGAITGTVLDPIGAVVPGVIVTAVNKDTSVERQVDTNDSGFYLIKNLSAGVYEIRFDGAGFNRSVITDVMVRSSSVVEVNVTLNPAGVTETVTVTAGSSQTDMSVNATLGTVSRTMSFGPKLPQTSTPRLRDYFPETLVWQPSLETNSSGRAQLKFKLADNITTWKMSVIGSTADGQIGTVEKEFRAFQPFFVDLDPPRILTEGDQISLPVVVRNYLERPQQVNLEMKPESWFSLSGPTRQPLNVPAGDSATGTFVLRAVSSVKDGKQRVSALGGEENDAIEKPVTVHPDGEELSATASDIVTNRALLEISIPHETIKGSARAELKLYPNLMAHVVESVEAIMSRPYGCGEQTISSTYPSLLLLHNRKLTGADFPNRLRAEKYLREGYDRLLNYHHVSGGVSYWSKGQPDIALTAYALRFLSDAQTLIDVDQSAIARARDYLIKQQQTDGSWSAVSYGNQAAAERRTALLTAYVARSLAMTRATKNPAATPNTKPLPETEALKRALDFLAIAVNEIDEPYLLAMHTLVALDAGDAPKAEFARAKLRSLAHFEGAAAYWTLETNTPFYGWGMAGRVETTALVVQALSRQLPTGATTTTLTPPPTIPPPDKSGPAATHPATQTNEQLIRSGLLFLLKKKDRYGVWYSTQATINVLAALLAQLAKDTGPDAATSPAEVLVNGRLAETIQLPPAGKLVAPILLDVSRHLQPGKNEIEIRRDGAGSPASAQVVANYYVPWAHLAGEKKEGLRLSAQFNKTEGKIGDELTCSVTAERVGFVGYGMLLAEIGLPPGADVDRASLDEAVTKSNQAIHQYDVLPDRVVLYLWPRAGGVSFDFKFRPRFGLQAKTASSTVYDYYNPEARTTVAPAAFKIR